MTCGYAAEAWDVMLVIRTRATSPIAPADCGRAAEAMSVPVTAALDVICDCGSKYCFKCKQEAHRPVRG